MKLTEVQKIEIIKLREKGEGLESIGKKFKVSSTSILYHTNKKFREKVKKYAREEMKNLSKEEMKERNKKYYNKDYFRNRYQTNEEARKKMIEENTKHTRRRYLERLEKGLCPVCGAKRDSKFKMCEECRRKVNEKNKKRK